MRANQKIWMLLVLFSGAASAEEPLRFTVKTETVLEHDDGKFLWFHPRVAVIPKVGRNSQPAALLTLQKHLHASDHYSGLYYMRSDDLGTTWTKPELPPELDWRRESDAVDIAVADVTPGWHAPTGKVIAIGAAVRYNKKGQELDDRPRSHQTAYAVYDPKTGKWTGWKRLEMPQDEKFNFARSACAQWLVQDDGKLLLPFYFGRNAKEPWGVTVVQCSFSDVQTAEMLNLPRPRLQGGKPTVVACPMSDEQHELQQELVERYERLRSQKVDPRVDNALAITTDGRKLATDARMLSATAPDFPESKVNRLVENVVATWKDTAAKRGTQMIFADMGVNPTAWGYSPYCEVIASLTADEATATEHAHDAITIGRQAWPREDAPAILGGKLDALPLSVRDTTRVPLGTYRGLRFGLVLHPQFPADVYLEGSITRQYTLSRDHQGPGAVLNALERLATGYASESARVRQDLSIAESQLRDYQARLGKPFTHDAYLAELTSLRDQLKAGLSASAAHPPDKEEGPSVSELADKIKALKAANSIEATPQRVRQKHSTAEEPITTRIRRRVEANPVADQSVDQGAASAEAAATDTTSLQNSQDKTPMTFQERIALEQQQMTDGQSPG